MEKKKTKISKKVLTYVIVAVLCERADKMSYRK